MKSRLYIGMLNVILGVSVLTMFVLMRLPVKFRIIYILLMSGASGFLIAFGSYMLIPSIKSQFHKFRKHKKVGRVEAEIPATVRIASTPFFRPFTDTLVRFIERDMELAGVYEHPQYFVSAYIISSIVLTIVLTPISIYLAVTVNPILSFLTVVPLIILVVPKFNLILRRAERKDTINDELPFFAAFAMIYQAVGKSISEALVKASQSDIFKQVKKEGVIVGKHLRMGEDDITTLTIVSKNHPNERFRTLLLGYTSVLRSGGDLLTYLETKLKDFVEEMKFRWQKYVEDSTNISEVTLMLLFIFPTLMLAGAFILPGESLAIINLFAIFIVPTIFAVIFVITATNQPKTNDTIEIPVVIPLLSAFATSLLLYMLNVDKYVVVVAGITTFATINGAIAYKQLNEITYVEKALPRFLRDITEYRKMGYDLVNAIIITSEEVRYSKVFDKHLSYIASQLRLGRPMNEIIREVRMRSYLERVAFNLLATGIEEGEIKPTQLETLIDFITTVNRIKRETKAKLRLNTIISFIAPLGLILTTYMIAGVMTYFTSAANGLNINTAVGQSFTSEVGVKMLIDSAKVLMISSALGIGLLAGKISDFTAKSTLKLAVIMCITLIALLFGDVLSNLLMRTIMGGF